MATKSSKDQQLAKKWIGGGTGNKTVEQFVDPLGVGDAFFGGDPVMADTSGFEAERAKAVRDWEATLPTSYKRERYLGGYNPEMVGELDQLGDTELSGISTNPEYDRARMAALHDLEDISKDGLSAQDEADLARLEGDIGARNAGRMGAIKQGMAARGMGGSGMELLAQMQAAQGSTQQHAQAALDKAAMAQNNRRAAIAQMGQLGGQMKAQDFGQQAQVAQAQDAINRFNTGNSVQRAFTNTAATNQAGQFNAGQAQGVEGRNTAAGNSFSQNHFDNVGGISRLKYNEATDGINTAKTDYTNAVTAKQKKKDGILNTGVQVLGAVGMMSDERVKTDIQNLSDEDVEELLESIKPRKFKYKNAEHGEGQRVGVMAQDLERSEMGKALVKDGPEGKQLDINNVIGALLDSVAHLHRKTRG